MAGRVARSRSGLRAGRRFEGAVNPPPVRPSTRDADPSKAGDHDGTSGGTTA